MKQLRRLLAITLVLSMMMSLCPLSANAEVNNQLDSPDKGIPLFIVHVNEAASGDYKTISEMNASEDHSVKCTGNVEIKVPDGYKSEYGDYELAASPMELDFIRGRGNSTWHAAKKPYKLKFKEKQNIFGMGANKNWELIANAFDPTQLKNRITYWLGEQMGFSFTPNCVPVELVMEGATSREYLGLYLLTEGVRVDKSRVNIDELSKDDINTSGDSNISGGYLLSFYSEMQNYDEPASNVFTTNGGVSFINDTPSYASEDALTAGEKAQRNYIRNYVQEVEDLILSGDAIDAERHKKIAEMLDLKSTVDYWWINEFSQNGDAYGTDSTFLYKERDGKLFFGPLWDFDMGWGEVRESKYEEPEFKSAFNETRCAWIDALRENDPEFRKLMLERWKVFDKALTELTRDGGVLDQYKNEQALAQKADYEKYSEFTGGYSGASDYDAVIDYMKQMIITRHNTCSKYIESVPYLYTKVNYEVDGELFYQNKNVLWNMPDEPINYPSKEGYVFKGWLEKNTNTPLSSYQLVGETTFVPEFIKESDAIAPKALFLTNYETYVPLSEETYDIELELYPENATNDRISYSSSDEKIASITDNNEVRLNSTGDVTITLKTYNGISRKVKLHIYDDSAASAKDVTAIKASKSLISLKKGDVSQVSYKVSPSGILKSHSVRYTSDNENVAEVNYLGVVKAKKAGTAVITCSLCDDNYNVVAKDFVIVNVGDKGSKKNTVTLKGKTVNLKAKKLAKKKQTVAVKKAFNLKKAKGSMTYVISSVSPTKAALKIKINKSTGKLTIAKGLSKGTYKVKVLANAAGNKTYAPINKTATVKIVVK
ncbi:MAG: CotH kinase family protein [Lachnospiraceae bacterium]|nr:CotH kinase family protein [Lachnospiraceae bacterium]